MSHQGRLVFVGFDPREAAAFAVARHSIKQNSRTLPPPQVLGLVLSELRGIYTRPIALRDGRLWDVISDAPMATEFAVTRFLIGELARRANVGHPRGQTMSQLEQKRPGEGNFVMFMDCDMLVRADIEGLFKLCDPTKAVMCVKHDHQPVAGLKMDGQVQTSYPRKNWSSVFALNVDHPANAALTVDLVNSVPGRDLHRFCWLQDDQIGALPVEWNWLAGHSDPEIDPKIVHHTDGSPCMAGYEDVPFADEWRAELADWALGGGKIS